MNNNFNLETALTTVVHYLSTKGIVPPLKTIPKADGELESETVTLLPLSTQESYNTWIDAIVNSPGPEFYLALETSIDKLHYRLVISEAVGMLRFESLDDNYMPTVLYNFTAMFDKVLNDSIGVQLLNSRARVKAHMTAFVSRRHYQNSK